jgi:LuxR family maltose regulon positive regulatory protein
MNPSEANRLIFVNGSPFLLLITHKSFISAPFEFLERVINLFYLFDQYKTEQIIVLDDFHLITNTELMKRLPDIFRSLPNTVTLCILSRAEPPSSFSEFAVKNEMEMINAENLTFTVNEIESFFASHGQALTEQKARDIFSATGGWIIALNALYLSGKQQTGRKLLSRYLETFIREQIWEKWDNARRDFLLCISVEDELTPDFCNAMTGRDNSAEILETLVRENAFISVDDEQVYRLHHLFRDFLSNMLENDSKKKSIYQKAGDWSFIRGNYYKAVEYYIKCENKSGITKGLKLMYNYNSPYAAIEDTLSIIRISVNGSIVDEYPFLLEVQAWAAYVEGQSADMEKYLDRYFKQLPKIIIFHPASVQTAMLLRCMDYRNSMIDVTRSLKKLPLRLFGQSNTPSLSQNMPHFHRSGRDFSEYASDDAANFTLLRKTIGVLVGEVYGFVEDLIRSGLAYERGNLASAYELALSANTKLKESYAPEIQFCAYMILATISNAQGQSSDTQKILDGASVMIEQHKAYYLNMNLRAFICRLKLENGDVETARSWLKYDAVSPHSTLSFYKLYQHFTTARAYITIGDYGMAILFLKKLHDLCEQYRRPLDTIEACILLAIAYWKKARGQQNDAFEPLTKAIISAQKYGFTQAFANDGAELSNMLHKLHKRTIQKDYDGEIPVTEVKKLYIMALTQAKKSRGLTGGRTSENVKYTEQQKIIMNYLNDGLTHKEMAEKMGLKPSTIKTHMGLIFKKLDVSNGVDAIIKIKEQGLI